MDCCCFPVSGKKEKLSLLGLKPHGWWQRKKGQHKCAGFKECKSGRAAANKERSDTWGIAWYLLAITDMDFFFSLLPRFIWCFLFCSVLCWLANWSPFLCLEVSIYIHGLLSKTFHKICSISVKILLLIDQYRKLFVFLYTNNKQSELEIKKSQFTIASKTLRNELSKDVPDLYT